MGDKTLISLDKFILLILLHKDSSIEDINNKIIIFVSSVWYQH